MRPLRAMMQALGETPNRPSKLSDRNSTVASRQQMMCLGSVLYTANNKAIKQKFSPNSKMDCVVQVSGQKGTKTVVYSFNAGFNSIIQPD